ncbi:autophagy protein 13 [Cryptotrichosporon argae]
MSSSAYPPSHPTPPPELANSSASSSQMSQLSRADQISHRLYLKTVGVLVDARLTHYGAAKAERKKDKWFNVGIHECDVHRADLQIYRSLSSYSPAAGAPVPPLLIAFILDTSDIPAGQTLTWTSGGRRLRLDPGAVRRGTGGRAGAGIVLERWTFSAASTAEASQTASLAIHSAYRLGIVHFRALYAVVRLLPAYRLSRRLRRTGSGLRVGIKLWAPDGYPPTPDGMADAWHVMERDLVGLDTPLDQLVPGAAAAAGTGAAPPGARTKHYVLPPADLFGYRFELAAAYRPDVEFHVEAIEAILSEKFVDMDEDWFTPTVARHRLAADAQVQGGFGGSAENHAPSPSSQSLGQSPGLAQAQSRAIALSAASTAQPRSAHSTSATAVPFPSPIPNRQQGAPVGSFGSSLNRPAGSRAASGAERNSSLGVGKWGAFAEGLPFATSAAGTSTPASREPSSPGPAGSGASITARRLSAQSLQPFRSISASPSASILRAGQGTTPVNAPVPQAYAYGRPLDRPSSIGRTSSFLSQSGRSFTHAQMANMVAAHGGAGGSSSSPPVGSLPRGSPTQPSPVSPSSLTFSKQHFPRSHSGRPHLATAASSSSPFVPGSFDRESPIPSSPGGGALATKRYSYSSSLSRRPTGFAAGSAGSGSGSGLGSNPPPLVSHSSSSADASVVTPSAAYGQGLLRRTSTRESGLRHSVEREAGLGAGAGAAHDDIAAFLRQLDTLAPPPPPGPGRAADGSNASSTAPLLPLGTSAPRRSDPIAPAAPDAEHAPAGLTASAAHRAPLTKTRMDDLLRRMAGSFSADASPSSDPPTRAATRPASTIAADGVYGLLTASRPSSAAPMPLASPPAVSPGPAAPIRPPSAAPTPTPVAVPVVLDSTTLSPPAPTPAAPPPPVQRTLSAGLRHSASGGSLGLGLARASDVAPRAAVDGDGGTGDHAGPSSPTTARSLPGKPSPHVEAAAAATPTVALSPQTTGGTGTDRERERDYSYASSRRRGPVLVRGGFGPSTSHGGGFGVGAGSGSGAGVSAGSPSVSTKASASSSSSPSHSPIRDYARPARSARLDRVPGAGGVAVSLGQAGAAVAVDDEWRRRAGLGLRARSGVAVGSGGGGVGWGVSTSVGGPGASVGSMALGTRKAVSRGASPEGREARTRVVGAGDGDGAFRRLGLGPAER